MHITAPCSLTPWERALCAHKLERPHLSASSPLLFPVLIKTSGQPHPLVAAIRLGEDIPYGIANPGFGGYQTNNSHSPPWATFKVTDTPSLGASSSGHPPLPQLGQQPPSRQLNPWQCAAPSARPKEHREVASEKVAVIEDHTWSGLLAADEEEFDLDVVVPANTEEEIEDSVQNTTKDSSEPIDSIGDAAAASKESSSDESKTARARVVGPTSEQPSHAPWPVTDVTRFNRRGIGPRRPLPSASREAASKILVSSVTRETRTTESLLLMTKEVKLSSVSGKRRLDFETDDSPKQSCGIADGQRFDLNNFGNERLNPVTYENREHHGGGSGGSHAKNVRDIVSPLDTSGGSCNTDILSIDISNEIFSDGSYNARNVSQFDKTINSVEQSSFANDAHVEDFTKLERSTYSRRRSSIYSTPIKLFSNNEPSNIDKTAVVGEKFSEPRIEVSFQKELKEDSFALRGKNLGPTHDTTACDSEAEHSVAAVTQEYDSSMPAESLPQVSLVSENEIAPVGSIVISASQMESFSDKPKVGMGDMSSPREQDVRVQAFVEVNVSHRIEDSSLKNVSEPVKLTGNLSEVANESQIAVKEGGNKAAEDVSLLSTGVTELHPNENCAADKVSETLPNSTDLLKRKDQAQERTSKSNDVEEYSKGKEYDDSLSKLLNVEGRIADSMEVNISDVRQIELSQQKRIPFGLSSELLSKEFSNGLMHESVVQVTESSEETAVGQQTKCDSLPQVSFNVSHSTTAQENTVKSSEVAGTSSKDFAYTITGIKEVGTSNSGDKCDAIKLPAITHTSHYKESIEGQNEAAAEHKNGKSAKDMTTLKRFKVEEKSRELSSSSLIHGAVVQETEPIEKRTSVNLTSCGSSDISYDVMCSTLVKKHSIESSKITDASQSVLPESIGGAKEAVTLSFADKQDILNQSKKTDASSGVHKEPTVYSTEALVSDGVSLRCNSPEVVNIKSSSISLVRGAVMCERECTENISDDNQTSGGLSQMSPGVVHSKTIQESTGEFELAEATSRVLTEYVDNFKATVASSFGDKQDVIKLSRETDTPLTNREVDRNDNRKEAIGIENGKSVDYIRSLGNVQQDLSNSVSSFMLPGIETIAKGLGDSLEMPHEVIHGTLLQKHAVQASDITGTLPNVFSECIEGAKEVVVLNSASKQESTEKITNENCAASVSPSKMSLDVIHTTIDQKSTGEFRVAEASSRVLVECTDNVTESVVSSISDKQDGITQYIETDKCKTENGKLFKLVSQDSQCVEAQANNVHDVLVEDIQSERICADALHSVSKSDVVPSPTRNVLELRSRSLERSSNDNLTSTTVALENADRKNKSIPEDSASKIFEQGMSSCLEKEHLSLNFNTEKSVAGKDYESDGKAMNIDNSSMKKVDLAGRVVQEEVDQLPGAIQLPEASVSKTDGTEIKTSALPRSPDSLQMEDTSSRIDHEDKIEEGKEGSVLSVVQTEASETEKKKNLTNSDDFQLKDMVQNYSEKQYTRLGSVEKYEVTNIQKSNMDNIAIGNIKNHTASSNLSEELQTSDLPGCTAREMTTKLLKSVVSHSLVSGNVGNKIDTVDIVAVMSVDAIPIRETQGETIQSESGEACIASTVLIVDTKIKNRNPDNTEVVPSEIPTQYLPNSGEEELVTHSKVAGLSTLDHSELNDNTNENQISDVTLAEVHSRNIESGVSQHGAVLESQKIDAASAIYQETNDESEIPVITDVSCSAVSDILAETSETDVKETVDNLCSNMSVQDLQSGRFCVDTLHSADKADVLTVPSGDILKLRSRCVERSLDDADLLTKCKSESWELNTGMGKKRRSMSLLSLDIDVREVSTPPKRQRRVSLSCSGELRHDTPPLRRSLRLSSGVSGSEDDLSSTMSNPSTKLTSRGKRKGHVTKKHLQTVYEDMELMTEAARKKHAQILCSAAGRGDSHLLIGPRSWGWAAVGRYKIILAAGGQPAAANAAVTGPVEVEGSTIPCHIISSICSIINFQHSVGSHGRLFKFEISFHVLRRRLRVHPTPPSTVEIVLPSAHAGCPEHYGPVGYPMIRGTPENSAGKTHSQRQRVPHRQGIGAERGSPPTMRDTELQSPHPMRRDFAGRLESTERAPLQ
ncbi:hypothetical protein PR048_027424 [Dryococelus australis]|uniref:Uncharacterized protein n=1 Tax=Dryococelus australis TaxID=614101 RepID=A0ABQ9GFF2_9NEOP|nr:hypothetical protein PR048_027424 [Dryococelus australis]